MGKRLTDKDGDKVSVVSGARKARNRNYSGKFPIRKMTYRKAEAKVNQMYRPLTGMYSGWGGY